jgi:hypothetical protein
MLFNLSPIISNILFCGEDGGSVNGGCEFGVSTHSGVVDDKTLQFQVLAKYMHKNWY